MSYVLQRASRGVGAIAAFDGHTGLGLMVGGKLPPKTPGIYSPIPPSQPPSGGPVQPVLTATPIKIPAMIAGSATSAPVVVATPIRTPVRASGNAVVCETGYFYSSKKSACQANCQPGYFLDSGDNCMPIATIEGPAVPPPSPAPSAPIVAPSTAPSGGTTPATATTPATTATPSAPAAPVNSGLAVRGGGSDGSWLPAEQTVAVDPLEYQNGALLPATQPPARARLSTGQMLLIGGLGLGALYLLFR